MKKMIALLLACIMVFAMVACASTSAPAEGGVEAQKPEAGGAEDQMPAPAETPVEEPADEPAEEPAGEPAEEPSDEPAESTQPAETPDEAQGGKLQGMLDSMLDGLDAEFLPYYGSYAVTKEDAPYVVGYEQMDTGFTDALAYGPFTGSTAFIMVLFELPDDADAEAFAADLSENADKIKWICVSADYADGVANGQYVMFLMASLEACPEEVRQELAARFQAIDTGALTD